MSTQVKIIQKKTITSDSYSELMAEIESSGESKKNVNISPLYGDKYFATLDLDGQIVPSHNISLQSKEITENGTYTPDEGYDGLSAVIVNVPETVREVEVPVQPKLQLKNATENGIILPDEGFDGLSSVIVNVPETVREVEVPRDAVLQTKELTENGEFGPDEGFDGFRSVTVNVQSALHSVTLTDNGTYTPAEGFDGFNEVTVNVPEVVREVEVPAQPVLQAKTITENGVYTADSGYDGLGEVSVNIPELNGMILKYTISKEFSQYIYNKLGNNGGTIPANHFNISLVDGTITYTYNNIQYNTYTTTKTLRRPCPGQTDPDANKRNIEINVCNYYDNEPQERSIIFSPGCLIGGITFPELENNRIIYSGDELLTFSVYGNEDFTAIIDDTIKVVRERAFCNWNGSNNMIAYFKNPIPCKLEEGAFEKNHYTNDLRYKIYVPYSEDHSVLNAYKTADGWSEYADIIYESDPE